MRKLISKINYLFDKPANFLTYFIFSVILLCVIYLSYRLQVEITKKAIIESKELIQKK